MATWQYAVHLIPRRKLIQLFSDVPKSVDRETFNSTDWWNPEDRCPDYEAYISLFLKESQPWSKDIRAWGDEQGDYISVMSDSGHVLEVEARIDVRQLNKVFIENLCRFASTCDCLLLTEDSILVEADFNLLLHQIGQSKAYAFVSDPVGFLDKIRTG